MIRTQISLPEAEYNLVQKEAKRLGVSVAEFFRRALIKSLPVDSSKPWMMHCGFIESGDSNSSLSVDEIVYTASTKEFPKVRR